MAFTSALGCCWRGVHYAFAQAQPAPPTPASNSVPVTADNFIRAESDAVFTGLVAQGGFGKFYHNRELTPIDSRIVQRANRDTLYSTAVFDLDAGPVTITLPDAGNRYYDDDHDRRGSLRVHGRLWGRPSHPHQSEDRHALRRGGDPHPGRSERS